MRETVGEAEVALLRRYEPILRFSRGEQFYPMDAEEYIRNSQLCVLRPNELPDTIVPRGALTGAQLGRLRYDSPGAIYYLHFVDPLAPAEVQHFRATSTLHDFHAGQGRLARVGLLTRLGDLIFSISLLLRGKVPGGQAAAAALLLLRARGARPGLYRAAVLAVLCLQRLALVVPWRERPRGRLGDGLGLSGRRRHRPAAAAVAGLLGPQLRGRRYPPALG
jgi:hypothetical protein